MDIKTQDLEALILEMDAVSKEYIGFSAVDEITSSTLDSSSLYIALSISTLYNAGVSQKVINEILHLDPRTAPTLTSLCEIFRNPDNALVFRQMVEAMERTEAFVKVKEAMNTNR